MSTEIEPLLTRLHPGRYGLQEELGACTVALAIR